MKTYQLFVKCKGGHMSSLTYLQKDVIKTKLCPICQRVITTELFNRHKTEKHLMKRISM